MDHNYQDLHGAVGIPKYLRLQKILAEQIQSGKYKVGAKFSTDIELKNRYRLSASTVVHALTELERSGFVTRKRGAGTFVKSRHGISRKSAAAMVAGRLLFICGAAPDLRHAHGNINWFIGHEIYRGLVNSFDGHVKIVQPEELVEQLELVPPDINVFVAAVNKRQIISDALSLRKETPFVIIDQLNQNARPVPNTIGLDHTRGVYDAMVHLMDELSHRDVAFIGPKRATFTTQHRGRWAGYRLGLESFGIPLREELVVCADSGTIADGRRAARQLLERKVKFTAVFVATDLRAIGAIRLFREAGLKVPEDISVVGFDDVPGVEENDPPLTTVRLPYFEAGAEAVKLLEMPPKTDGTRPGRVLASRLVVRASCAPKTDVKRSINNIQYENKKIQSYSCNCQR